MSTASRLPAGGGELATRAVDLPSAGIAYRDGNPPVRQASLERGRNLRLRPTPPDHGVGAPPCPPRYPATGQPATPVKPLGDDLGRGQVPGQACLAGRAERACHSASRLR